MNYPKDDSEVTYEVPLREGGKQEFNLPSVLSVRSVFSVGYNVRVFKLKTQNNEELVQRVYTADSLTDVTSTTNEPSFIENEYSSNFFPYSYLAYEEVEDPPDYLDRKYSRSCAFTIYRGSNLEEIENQGKLS